MAIDTAADIPVIDISPSNADAAKQLREAASTWGFVYVRNDGTDIARDDLRYIFHAVCIFATPSPIPS